MQLLAGNLHNVWTYSISLWDNLEFRMLLHYVWVLLERSQPEGEIWAFPGLIVFE